MSEIITFENIRVGVDDVRDMGDAPHHEPVLAEMSEAFQAPLDDMAEFVHGIAPSPRLQENIDHVVETLSDPEVRARVGYGGADLEGNAWTPYTLSRDWAERVKLQSKVLRPLMAPAVDGLPERFDAGLLPGRVVRWMNRMGTTITEVGEQTEVGRLVVVSADRTIGGAESPDVEGGTSEHRYMSYELAPRLGDTGLFKTVEMHRSGEKRGDDVMASAARHLDDTLDLGRAKIIVPAVAGNWMQTGVQLRSALQNLQPEFDTDPKNPQLWVASDEFSLGTTGQEPKETHQNPASALGNIARGAKLFNELR